jgi:hypothetical protein
VHRPPPRFYGLCLVKTSTQMIPSSRNWKCKNRHSCITNITRLERLLRGLLVTGIYVQMEEVRTGSISNIENRIFGILSSRFDI